MSARARHLPIVADDPRDVATTALRALPSAPLSRQQLRSRRKREVRARTISVKRMTKRELELGRLLYPEVEDVERPQTRADCANGERPCPFAGCKHHLYLDVSAKTGAIKLNLPDLEPHEMAESCVLDIADRGAQTLERTAEIMNLTRERIRQIEVRSLERVRVPLAAVLADHDSDGAGDPAAAPAHPLAKPDVEGAVAEFDHGQALPINVDYAATVDHPLWGRR